MISSRPLIALCSNPYYRADAKEFVFIMQIFIILSDKGPEFGRDDCWLFVFQYSFATQRLKLGKNMLYCLIFFNAICAKY